MTLPNDAMARLFEATPSNDLPQSPNYNVCPTDPVHTVFFDGESRRLVAMRWGFVPHWYKSLTDGPLLINARSEKIAEKPAFKSACRQRRAILIASGFYEWVRDGGERQPWFIRRNDEKPLIMAAVWQSWVDRERDQQQHTTVAIVTTQACPEIAHIHHRMPVILDEENVSLWLGEQGKGAANLMRPAKDSLLTCHPVRTEVNSNRAEGPHLTEPFVEGA